MLQDLEKRIERIARGDSDGNDVHRFRTACRRLEAVLTELVYADRTSSPDHALYQAIRKARKKAGDARDIDVSHQLVQSVAMPLDSRSHAVCNFLNDYLKSRRGDAIKELERTANRRRVKNLPGELRKVFEKNIITRVKIKRVLTRCITHAQKLASKKLTTDALHRTRLALKRLRDVARIVEPLLGSAAKSIAVKAGHLSDRLGKAQDLFVLVSLIDDAGNALSSPPQELAALRTRLVKSHVVSQRTSVQSLSGLKVIAKAVSNIRPVKAHARKPQKPK